MASPGDHIGRYELKAPLGEGGMGEVWEAVLLGPAGFRKPVALKLLREAAGPETHRDALIREARLGAMLAHPNVVATYELGQTSDGRWFLAMELVRGPSVADLASAGRLPADAILEIGIQACAGLAHVHGLVVDGLPAGLVHRDIKPQNLLVDRSGLVKLADLGVARLRGGPGDPAGTRGYMPPEQAAGQADPRSDLFALGVSLYKLCARRKPVIAATPPRLRAALADPDLMAPVEAVVPGLGAVLTPLLALDPADRPPDAGTVQAALRAVRNGLPRGPSLVDVLVARHRRDRAPTSVITAGTSLSGPVPLAPELPAALDSFVGRSHELEAVGRRIRSGPGLVTLLGPGGMGKTRLSLEVARAFQQAHGTALFCDLSHARTLDAVITTMAGVLALPLDRDDAIGRIGQGLAGRGRTLVVLDNLEQVVEPASTALRAWLAAAPYTTFLATSQVALRIRGERVVPLDPLSLEAATQLFLARAARPIPEVEQDGVRELVQRLDGLPLAIELAAARTRVLSVDVIRTRLEDRFQLLAAGPSELPERHRSLRASLDGSWELLPTSARTALGQLSVFSGTWTLPAAEAVVLLPEGSPWVLDVLDDLGTHSLLRADPATGRFRLLASVQEYAATRLDDGERALAQLRHAEFYARFGQADELARAHNRGGQALWEQLSAELENFVAASTRAVAAGRRDLAAANALAAWAVIERRGPFARGVALLESAHDLGEGPRTGDLLRNLGVAHRLGGRYDLSRTHFEQSLGRAGPRGDGQAWVGIATLDLYEGHHAEARELYERALDIIRPLGERGLEALCLTNIATTHALQGHLEIACDALREAIDVAREEGARRPEASATLNLGNALLEVGRPAEAQKLFEDARSACRDVGERMLEGIALCNLGSVLFQRGRYLEARRRYQASLDIARSLGNKRSEAVVLGNQGELDRAIGNHEAALERLTEALELQELIGDVTQRGVLTANLGDLHLSEGRLTRARELLEASLELGRASGYRRGEVEVLGSLARLELLEGDPDAAVRHAHEAVEVATSLGRPSMVARAYLDRGWVWLSLGQADAARVDADQALTLLDGRGFEPDEVFAVALRATALGDRAGLNDAASRARTLGVGPKTRLATLLTL